MNKTVKKYIGIGIILGLLFPAGAILFEYIRTGGNYSVYDLHKANPLLWIIDSAPIFLGLASYVAGINQRRSEDLLLTVEKHKSEVELALATTERSHEALKGVFNQIKNSSPELVKYVGDVDSTILDIIRRLDHITDITSNSITSVSSSLDTTSEKMYVSSVHIDDSEKHTIMCEKLTSSYIEKMSVIVDTVNTMSSTFDVLRDYSKEFDSILGFINKVSKETRLLSLNASVEASRAGHEGAGFSVIADSIRTMAENISEATQQISGQILQMHTVIDQLDNNVSSIIESVETGSKLTSDTKTTIQNISARIGNLKSNMNDISIEINDQVVYVQNIGKDSDDIHDATKIIKDQLKDTKEPINHTLNIMFDLQQRIESLVG